MLIWEIVYQEKISSARLEWIKIIKIGQSPLK